METLGGFCCHYRGGNLELGAGVGVKAEARHEEKLVVRIKTYPGLAYM